VNDLIRGAGSTDRGGEKSMNVLFAFFFAVVTFAIASPALAADSPFVGTWKVDRAKSSFAGDSMTYKAMPDGTYAFNYGTATHYTFACDGKTFKTDVAGYSGTCKKTGPQSYAFTSITNGKLTDEDTVTISADGKTYTDAGTHYRPDGKTAHDTTVYTRVGSGSGIAGTWKTAKVSSNAPYSLVFTSTPAGIEMVNPDYKWKVVMKTDGSKAMLTGPTVPSGAYVVTTADGPSTMHVAYKLGDKTFSDNTMKVSADGSTLSWTSQAPGNTATTMVYDKQ
jgi:hypothetical protein